MGAPPLLWLCLYHLFPPVSYTHLLGNSFNRRVVVTDEIEMNINVLLAVNGSTACGFVNLNPVNECIAVSYTHLDVYKRQSACCRS